MVKTAANLLPMVPQEILLYFIIGHRSKIHDCLCAGITESAFFIGKHGIPVFMAGSWYGKKKHLFFRRDANMQHIT
jgi:hypothetical protein